MENINNTVQDFVLAEEFKAYKSKKFHEELELHGQESELPLGCLLMINSVLWEDKNQTEIEISVTGRQGDMIHVIRESMLREQGLAHLILDAVQGYLEEVEFDLKGTLRAHTEKRKNGTK